MNIKMTKEHFRKNDKNKWILEYSEHKKDITEQCYNNIIDAKNFFRNLGGIERHVKSSTCYGYIVTHITSISPDKSAKSIYQFNFS